MGGRTKAVMGAGNTVLFGMYSSLGACPFPCQVRHRCPCTAPAICGAEEEAVQKVANEGKMPSNYILP